MSQRNNLSNVIRLESNYIDARRVLRKNQKITIIDVNTGKIYDKNPVIKIGKNLKYYIISTSSEAKGIIDGYCIKNSKREQSLELIIHYEVSCSIENETKIVEALHKDIHPQNAFETLIVKFVDNFMRNLRKENKDVVQEFVDYKEDLQKNLEEETFNRIGLNADFDLTLKNKDKISKIISKKSIFFPVRVKDCDEELNIKFDIDLSLDEDNEINAIIHYSEIFELENYIQTKIENFILNKVNLHKFIFNLNNTVKDELRKELDSLLAKKGRKIARFKLKYNKADFKFDIPKEFIKFDIPVFSEIQDYTKKIEIKHLLQLQLDDIAKYIKMVKNKNLEGWIKEHLENITSKILFSYKYVKILTDFSKDKKNRIILNDIKTEIEEIIEQSGYSVQYIMVDPNLKPLKLKSDGFRINEEASFKTFDNTVPVKLNIVITGTITDLTKIIPNLTPETKIENEIWKSVRIEIENEMHKVDPERFYMPFNFEDFNEVDTIEERLRKSVSKKLKEKFSVDENHEIVIKTLDTKISDRFKALKNGNPYYLDVEVITMNSQKLVFRIRFNIERVAKEGWNTFLSKKFESNIEEIERIKETLSEDIESRLKSISSGDLSHGDYETKDLISEVIQRSEDLIIEIFGLKMEITFLRRDETHAEKTKRELINEDINNQKEYHSNVMKKDKETKTEIHRKISEETKEAIIENHKDRLSELDNSEQILEEQNKIFKSLLPKHISDGNRLLQNTSTKSNKLKDTATKFGKKRHDKSQRQIEHKKSK
jgi:hypothetical protein